MKHYDDLLSRLRSATKLPVLQALMNEAADAIVALDKPKGTWFDFCSRRFCCSACGNWNTYGKTKYCPECGARMEG